MIPTFELRYNSVNSAYDKVASWLQKIDDLYGQQDEFYNQGNEDLSLSLPPELLGGLRSSRARRNVKQEGPAIDKEFIELKTERPLSIPPELLGGLRSSRARRNVKQEGPAIDKELIELKTERLYHIVLEVVGGDRFRISPRGRFSQQEKCAIIRTLSREGYNVKEIDFYDIIRVAEAVVNKGSIRMRTAKDTDENYRHASLNCYDYLRLKEEMNLLADTISVRSIKRNCPTLTKIYEEALRNEEDEYPGRHLPYNRIGGIKAGSDKRYQCLRMMDEILCSNSSDEYFTNEEMEAKIKELAKSRKIEFRKAKEWRGYEEYSFSDGDFRHLYDILKQLISIENSSKGVKNHVRDVYETIKSVGATSGKFKNAGARRYKKQPNGKRLSAFAVDIAVNEIALLRKEVGQLRVSFFNDDREKFASMFPLISTLGYTEEVAFNENDLGVTLDEISATDLELVVYKSLKYAELKKKVKEAIKLRMPIGVKIENDWRVVYPLSIKDTYDKWVLVAKTEKTNSLALITPEMLSNSFENYSESFDVGEEEYRNARFIGTSELLMDQPQDVVIELTPAGIDEIKKETSPFKELYTRIEGETKRKFDEFQRGGDVILEKVYINEDFLKAVYELDKTGKFRSISPENIKNMYEIFFEAEAGQKWRHMDDRPRNSKRIKEKKNRANE